MPAQNRQLERDIENGKIVLGGCCITDNDPQWQCGECNTKIYPDGSVLRMEIARFISVDKDAFVGFWSRQYDYQLEHLYNGNIGKTLNAERVWELYMWKNGTKNISKRKQQSVQNVYLSELTSIPKLKTLEDGKRYLTKISGGPIWDIFWLHCINPSLFPIFDQHTYRSMAHIKCICPSEIPTSKRQKQKVYFDLYIPFTKQFPNINIRELDMALFAYGRFLKKGFSGK